MHSRQNSNFLNDPFIRLFLYGHFTVRFPLPKKVFYKNYPEQPKNFGERIRKYRIDNGLQIKQLAKLVGVTADSITNWELRNVEPTTDNKEILEKLFRSSGYGSESTGLGVR
jgi:DNA-binding XRE family transcriptional regulator